MTEENGSPPGKGQLPVQAVTVNQVVAWNLALYRRMAGLTQAELGTLIGWKKSAVSDAERSVSGQWTREFNAHELTVIATALGVPLMALLLPPEDDGITVRYEIALDGTGPADMADLMAVIVPESESRSAVMEAYRARLLRAAETYLAPGWAEDIAGWLGMADEKELNAARAARLRRRLAVLGEMQAVLAETREEWSTVADRLEKEAGQP